VCDGRAPISEDLMDSTTPQKPVRIVHLCYPGGSAQMIRDALAPDPHIQLAQVAARSDIREQIARGCDVFMTDVGLLGFDGTAAVDYLAEHWPQIPVVVCTAAGSERVAAQAVRSGAFDYLALPMDLGRLQSAIQQTLQRSTQRQAHFAASREMHRRRAELEHRLADCEAQLNVARRELRGLAESASELLSPPLAAITEAAHALQAGLPAESVEQRHVEDIAAHARRMYGVIDGLARAAQA
jgi:CheY-like chemotaxis protein